MPMPTANPPKINCLRLVLIVSQQGESHCRRRNARDNGKDRDRQIILNRRMQGISEHADEMHGPYAYA